MCLDDARVEVGPAELAYLPPRGRHVEPERVVVAGRDARGAGRRVDGAARPRIDRAVGARRRRVRRTRRGVDLRGDLAARAEAGIDEPGRLQPREGDAVVVEVIRLPSRRPIPDEAEPRQVLEDRGLELRAAARAVDVLDAEEEDAAARPRLALGEERGVTVAQVQQPRRGRREARDDARGGQRSSSYGPPRSSARR